ncbi:MAG: DegT/DnrJ/EryC1/StrS family aminotransferase [Patescibacteria group bacterium]|nr:DegT/DnrJ/EryC1/StrS family aminotransferase [Patescibacteria group bacterium]MCL5224318.1 DegT/DnrJ/EryC1/StrS family aminotransferase [Patescibacteria group bacterium]
MINISKPLIGGEEIDEVEKVLSSGKIAQGPVVAEFEKDFAEFCGVKYAIAVNSGTAALHCALYACGIKKGDEVVTTPFTFVATANAILMQGARPVFVDVNEIDFNIDADKIEEKLTGDTKAILPVDLYGQIYNVDGIGEIAHRKNLRIVEDACQSHGAEYKGKRAGIFGSAGCFSFYATKNMTTGEGGMVVTDDENIADSVKRFRHHGQSEKTHYEYYDLGFNYRMTDIEAAMGIEQLKKLKGFNEIRQKNARALSEGLAGIKGIKVPSVKDGFSHVFHQYTIRVTDQFKIKRDELSQYLTGRGIGNAVFYPKPLHLHPHFMRLGYKDGDFPISEKISKEVLSLPVNPSVSEQDIKYIVDTIKGI